MDKYFLPTEIQKNVKDMVLKKDNIGRSEASIFSFSNCERELYLKIEKKNLEFEHEQKIMSWLQGKLPVPEIIAMCKYDKYDYLLMTKVNGKMACSKEMLNNPQTLVRALAQGINQLQKINIVDCPFNCQLDYKLDIARQKISDNQVDIKDWEESTLFNSPIDLYDFLVENKPKEELVFTHGDYCLPNVFIDGNVVTGFIDLGRAGIADKWQDIALCMRSLEYNLKSREYTKLFFEYLNLEPDYEKIKYYMLLDELF